MILTDDHVHLNHKLYTDLEGVLERAKKAGVKAIICSGVNIPTNREVLKLARKYGPLVKCSFGIYPTDAIGKGGEGTGLSPQNEHFNVEEELEFIKKHKGEIAAIGEAGLDYHWIKDDALKRQMREIFEKVIECAEKTKLPLVVHSRKAESDCMDMLESSKVKKVVQHCFTGKKKTVKRGVDLGHFFSIPSAINRVPQFSMNAEIVPLKQTLTETDGPYMTPEPGRVSEPKDVLITVKKIAELKGLTPEEVANQIWLNFQEVYC